MPVVQIGRVGMAVSQRRVVVRVAVRSGGHRVVSVQVVTVVVGVGVFMILRLMLVAVGMVFGQMDQHPRDHQRATAE